jgi:hypothetical protein
MKFLKVRSTLLLSLLLAGVALMSYAFRPAGTASAPTATSGNGTKAANPAKKIKIALLLDTSNSMDGLIDQARAQLWTIVEELAKAKCDGGKPQVQIALYEYGNDRLPASEGYIRMVTPLTDDLDKLSADLYSLTTQGGNEFCGYAIRTACRELDWSADGDDFQAIFIAGNEPFTQGSVAYREACALAKSKHIVVNTIHCGGHDEGIATSWKAGADLTGGNYMSIEQDRKTVFIPSPYDPKIAQLNTRLNDTYLEYGTRGKEKKANQVMQDANAGRYGQENTVKRTLSKSTHIYKNSTWDLVDAAAEKDFDVEKIKTEELPEAMQSMDKGQKTQYIAAKKAERDQIKAEIGRLNAQREAYLAKQQKEAGNEKTLDQAMLQSIRKQAATKKLSF